MNKKTMLPKFIRCIIEAHDFIVKGYQVNAKPISVLPGINHIIRGKLMALVYKAHVPKYF